MRDIKHMQFVDAVSTDVPCRDDSLQALYARHWSELCNYLKKHFGTGPPSPEDLAQQAFMRFAAHAGAQQIENARAYLYRTAHNIAIDEHRRATSARHANGAWLAQRSSSMDELTPERVLIAEERLNVLRDAIAQLPATRRRSFLLNRLEGLGCAEIARRTGYSETAVKKHISLVMMDLERALTHAERARGGNGKPNTRD